MDMEKEAKKRSPNPAVAQQAKTESENPDAVVLSAAATELARTTGMPVEEAKVQGELLTSLFQGQSVDLNKIDVLNPTVQRIFQEQTGIKIEEPDNLAAVKKQFSEAAEMIRAQQENRARKEILELEAQQQMEQALEQRVAEQQEAVQAEMQAAIEQEEADPGVLYSDGTRLNRAQFYEQQREFAANLGMQLTDEQLDALYEYQKEYNLKTGPVPGGPSATRSSLASETKTSKPSPTEAQKLESNWAAKRAKKVLERFGIANVSVRYEGFAENENGYFDFTKNEIVLNGNRLTSYNAIVWAIGHELTHPAEEASPDLTGDIIGAFQRLDELGMLSKRLSDQVKGLDKLILRKKSTYAKRLFTGATQGLTPAQINSVKDAIRKRIDAQLSQNDNEYIRKEIAADWMAEVFRSQKLLDTFAKERPSILDRARTVTNNLRVRLSGKEYVEAQKLLDGLSKKLENALYLAADEGFSETTEDLNYSLVEKVQDVLEKKDNSTHNAVFVGTLPKIYESVGVPYVSRTTAITKTHLRKAFAPSPKGHDVKKELLVKLPELIKNPVIVLDADRERHPYSIVIVTNQMDNFKGKLTPLVIPIELNGHAYLNNMRKSSNVVASVYYPNDFEYMMTRAINEGRLLGYTDEAESLIVGRYPGIQFPGGTAKAGSLNIVAQSQNAVNAKNNPKRMYSLDSDENLNYDEISSDKPEGYDIYTALENSDPSDWENVDNETMMEILELPTIHYLGTRGLRITALMKGREKVRKNALDKVMKQYSGSWNGKSYTGEVKREHRVDIVMGLPGAGKTKTAINPLSQKNGALYMANDLLKEAFDEYDGGWGAPFVHDESGIVLNQWLKLAMSTGDNIVLETVGWDLASLEKKIAEFKDSGYSVYLHLVDVTPKIAMGRMLKRALPADGSHGRYLDPREMIKYGNKPNYVFQRLIQKEGLLNGYQVYDNRAIKSERKEATESARNIEVATGKSTERTRANSESVNRGLLLRRPGDSPRGDQLHRSGAGEGKRASKYRPPVTEFEGSPLSEARLRQLMDNANFRAWFFDGNGELLDVRGLPMIFYHGTFAAGFTAFRDGDEPGFWFAAHPDTARAEYYARNTTREFAPFRGRSWADAQRWLAKNIPAMELVKVEDILSKDHDGKPMPGYVYRVAETKSAMGVYPATKAGLDQFISEYYDLIPWENPFDETGMQSGVNNDAVYQVFLSMRNPLIVYGNGKEWNKLNAFMAQDSKEVMRAAIAKFGQDGLMKTRDFVELAKTFGYDGVIFKSILDGRVAEATGTAVDMPELENKVKQIIKKHNNFGMSDTLLALTAIEDGGVIPKGVILTQEEQEIINLWIDLAGTRTEKKQMPSTVAVVLKNTQIKSIYNPGLFSPTDPHIMHSLGDDYISDGETARWTPERINLLYDTYAASSPDYSQAYAAFITPDEFLSLTTTNPQRIESESAPLDREQLAAERQVIHLTYDPALPGEVWGHEGRHRMVALKNAGVKRVAIAVEFLREAGKYNRQPIESLELIGEEFATGRAPGKVTLRNLVPISQSYRPEIEALYGAQEGDVRYSLNEYTDEEKQDHAQKAIEHFGKTYNWNETGYLLTDGTRLDFSGKNNGGPGGERTVDHRGITEALGLDYGGKEYSGAMIQFMSEGNIRIMPETNGINLSVLPTKAQERALEDFISRARGEVILDLDDLNGNTISSTEYPKGTKAAKVLNDIRNYFENGTVPEVSEVSRFRYSLVDSEGNELSPEQAEFFKNSQVRDENGNLLVVYHGTDADFTVFDIEKAQQRDDGDFGVGFYLTPERNWANAYSYGTEQIMSLYANITNPFKTHYGASADAITALYEDAGAEYNLPRISMEYDYSKREYAEIYKQFDFIRKNGPKQFTEILQSAGYDGVIVYNDASHTGQIGEIVAFYPEQIKSVDNKNPTANPDIRFSLADSQEYAEFMRQFNEKYGLGAAEAAIQNLLSTPI